MSDKNVNLESASGSEKEVKYKGVRKRKWGKWVSEIRLPNSRERIWLGSYDSAEKAARAFDAALFCLRGSNAKYNFSDSPPPPDIVRGDRGRSLTPAEIQAIASQYANNYNEGQRHTSEEDKEIVMEDTSPSSTSDSVAHIDAIDWSFLDMLEPHETGATTVSDYSFISGLDNLHEDMYMPPHLGARTDNNDDYQEDENPGASYCHSSFLWNF